MYRLTENGEFIVENYNWKTSFSNFFPGISGKYGIPMWSYYVTRNQCMISAGVRDKNHQLMEFRSFNKALDAVSSDGFRTFLKTGQDIYEPFRKTADRSVKQKLTVSSGELELVDENGKLGIVTEVLYYPVVNTSYPALVRRLKVRNTKKKKLRLELLDGLPRILPYGADLHCVQTIARHVEGLMEAADPDGVPLFRLKQSPADVERVERVQGGNFYLSFSGGKAKAAHGRYFVDPDVIFGECEVYEYPWNFKKHSLKDLLRMEQVRQNRTPSAMTGDSIELKAGEEYVLYSLLGYAETDAKLRTVLKEAVQKGFPAKKRDENRRLLESIKGNCLTLSADSRLDRYCGQTFLDNVIRGGMPAVFPTVDGKTAFYLYSRQNGDLERDYHHFILEPTYFSQGTGHYRSVNQNRRCDTWFFPEVGDRNIALFMNLIQLDGYNPLEVTQMTYTVKETRKCETWLKRLAKDRKKLAALKACVLDRPFAPGEFVMKLEELEIKPEKDYDTLLAGLLSFSYENECGAIHEGFWTDHWFYNLDLIDNYLMIYPDRLKELFLDNTGYYFYDDPDVIRPRSEKYVEAAGRVCQYKAVCRDRKKAAMIASRKQNPKRVRTRYGKGAVYYTNPLVKLLCIVVNRMATLDPGNIGVEMEADKPGWNDSMNGLPGILGSSLCEALELEKALAFLCGSCGALKSHEVKLYRELYEFMAKLEHSLDGRLASKRKDRKFRFWDESHNLKEAYREKTKYGVAGGEIPVKAGRIGRFCGKALAVLRERYLPANRRKIFSKEGVPYTYYRNEAVRFDYVKGKDGKRKLHSSGNPLVTPKRFRFTPLPLFLEGPVHMLKVHPEKREAVYRAVRKSPMFDRKLRMYKVCESLEKAPFEIGRVKAWGPGWIENESVYTHMEYKYLLELLRSGLYDEFYRDIETGLAPYLDPKVYARSPFENVSFVVSSAFPDKKMHGRGLQPRLSGVTGEMINIWILMVAGKKPFMTDGNGELCFKLEPALHGRLFSKKKKTFMVTDAQGNAGEAALPPAGFAFRLFGRTLVTYLNRKRKNTYGKDGVKVTAYRLHYAGGESVEILKPVVPSPYSQQIREGRIESITAILD
ncbi:MAG: hypothetical protein KKH28_11245 [Elusimicrobia bacterium]|nr:hypothetical protein [Elusimicrobiota bacterium]